MFEKIWLTSRFQTPEEQMLGRSKVNNEKGPKIEVAMVTFRAEMLAIT